VLDDVEFIELMEELRLALSASQVEPYNFFVRNSVDGRECAYALKSLKVFQVKHERQTLEAILSRLTPGLSS